MSQKLIAGGAWVQILIDGDPVGLATQAAYDEDWAGFSASHTVT
jgi:hypothetical protein